ncbi:ebna1 binding protein 2-like [Plakobranchus ocellatus]|uniref:Ebna1 binding protein 2-like n=1 Tax=Plakobranchus ocellatus TaxID=259542 RepID=A0AAV4DBD0_9GAST|nr:ebna1 binding protein 2-like [Plakobranchus ocellatus]
MVDTVMRSSLDSDSDEEIQEALAAGTIKPGLVVEEQKKTFINNREGIKEKIKEFSLVNLKWIERLDLSNKPAPETNQITAEDENEQSQNDDFNREMRFYRQAQASVLLGLTKLAELSVPTKRPEDYFAEMAKSDDHMKKVRSKLLEKKMSLERSEKAKKLRELRKYGKKVQQEVLQQRQKEKKEMLDSVKKFRKGQVDKIDILDETIERQPKQKQAQQMKNGQFKPNKKREFKNKKFGFGGQKKRSKYNTAESAADVSEFRAKNAHGKGTGGNFKGKKQGKPKNQRPGKSRRKTMKNKGRK